MIQPRGLRLKSISKSDVALGWLTDCLCIPQLDRSSRRNKIPMTFEIHEILLIATAILLSSIVQGAVGFAVALIAIPLFLQAGLDLAQSIFVVLICGIVQNALGLRQTWHDTPIRKLTPWAIFRAALVPIGFLLMRFIENCSKSELRQIIKPNRIMPNICLNSVDAIHRELLKIRVEADVRHNPVRRYYLSARIAYPSIEIGGFLLDGTGDGNIRNRPRNDWYARSTDCLLGDGTRLGIQDISRRHVFPVRYRLHSSLDHFSVRLRTACHSLVELDRGLRDPTFICRSTYRIVDREPF